jgi:hypothetical protein
VRSARLRLGLAPAQYARHLVRAATHNDLPALQRAVEQHKVNIDARDGNGDTALGVSAEFARVELVRYCLSMRANPNHRNTVRRVALAPRSFPLSMSISSAYPSVSLPLSLPYLCLYHVAG